MRKPLHALIVEDSADDAELILHELARGGYAVTHKRVQTREAMQAALDEAHWDIVLSDYHMPGFSAPAALAVLQANRLDLPFLIVSGTIGEEAAGR